MRKENEDSNQENEFWIHTFCGEEIKFYPVLFQVIDDNIGHRKLSGIKAWNAPNSTTRYFKDSFVFDTEGNFPKPLERILKSNEETHSSCLFKLKELQKIISICHLHHACFIYGKLV
jgi:hypothetical protein